MGEERLWLGLSPRRAVACVLITIGIVLFFGLAGRYALYLETEKVEKKKHRVLYEIDHERLVREARSMLEDRSKDPEHAGSWRPADLPPYISELGFADVSIEPDGYVSIRYDRSFALYIGADDTMP